MTFARRMGERHGAAPVARQKRRAGIEKFVRQSLAAPIGRGEQRHVGLHGDGVSFDQLVVAGDFTAILLSARLSGLRGSMRRRGQCREKHRAGDGVQKTFARTKNYPPNL